MVNIICNVDLDARSDKVVEFHSFSRKKAVRLFLRKYFNLSSEFDAALIFNPVLSDLLFYFVVRAFDSKFSVFYFDVLLKKPVGVKGFIKKLLIKKMLSAASEIYSVHKDVSDYVKYYGDRLYNYVPFKANNFETRANYTIGDNGYVLSCGVSHRDYDTLLQAVEGLDIKVKIVIADEKNREYHKTKLTSIGSGGNVEFISHDFKASSWNEWLSKCSFVVIPIEIDCIQPAGISVYLESMALGKATIVSDGPSTRNMIDSGQARIVRRGDSVDMRQAIVELWGNSTMRNEIAEAGLQYALGLEGVDRLITDLKQNILRKLTR